MQLSLDKWAEGIAQALESFSSSTTSKSGEVENFIKKFCNSSLNEMHNAGKFVLKLNKQFSASSHNNYAELIGKWKQLEKQLPSSIKREIGFQGMLTSYGPIFSSQTVSNPLCKPVGIFIKELEKRQTLSEFLCKKIDVSMLQCLVDDFCNFAEKSSDRTLVLIKTLHKVLCDDKKISNNATLKIWNSVKDMIPKTVLADAKEDCERVENPLYVAVCNFIKEYKERIDNQLSDVKKQSASLFSSTAVVGDSKRIGVDICTPIARDEGNDSDSDEEGADNRLHLFKGSFSKTD